jgi:RNA polymerase sigma factor (sigma-70 family)
MLRLNLENLDLADDHAAEKLVALDEALERLATEDDQAAAVVKLRYFAGLTIAQAAEAMGISVRTANRQWAYARARLFQQLSGQCGSDP